MAYYTLAQWRATLAAELPNGPNLSQTSLNEAIRNAVAWCGTWQRDVQRVDFVGDGVTTRFAVTGVDVALSPADQQETPVGINTSGIAAPTTASTVSASGSGSTFLAGLHYGTYSLTSPRGETPIISLYQSVTLTAGQNFVFAAVTLTTGATGINYYVSPGPGDPDVRLAGTGTGAQKTLTAPPLATAARPLRAYVAIGATYNPINDVEQDVAADGTTAVGTATITMTAAPALGDRFRLVYTREPLPPTLDTDIIRVPEQVFKEAAIMFAARTFAFQHESGDQTMWLSMYDRALVLSQKMQSSSVPGLRPRPRIVEDR